MKTYKRIEDTGLYVDCNKLAECLYQVRFKMPKRDRAVLWEHIFKYCIDMTAFLQDAFRDKENRIKHIDSFLHSFAKMKVLLRMACVMLFVGKVLKSMKKKISWNENRRCFGLVRRKYGWR